MSQTLIPAIAEDYKRRSDLTLEKIEEIFTKALFGRTPNKRGITIHCLSQACVDKINQAFVAAGYSIVQDNEQKS